MASLTQRAPWLRYLAMVVVLAVVAFAVYLLTGGGTKTGSAYFKEAHSIYPGDAIEILGIEVGKVDKVTPAGNQVRVDFHYGSKYKLPGDVKAAIMSPTLVATRFIQLDPGYTSGPQFPNQGVIPQERTVEPVEFDELKKQLDQFADTLGPNGVNQNGALNRALHVINANGVQNGVGQGQPFHDMIAELSKAARTFSSSRGDLFGTVRNLEHFSSVLNQYDSQIVEFQDRLADVSGLLDDNSDQLRTLLPRVDDAADQVDKFLREHGHQLSETVDRAASVSRSLAHVRMELAQALHIAPTALSDFSNLFYPRTGEIFGNVAINYQAEIGPTPGNVVCAFLSAAAASNEESAQQTCVKQLGPLFSQLAAYDGAFTDKPIPPSNLPVPIVVPQGSVPQHGDWDSQDHEPSVNPSPNGSNSDFPRSSTANNNDHSYSNLGLPDAGIPVPNGGH
ncbi:MAG TPA: MCE family protein [Pseudonocardia sp.]|jgi:phospholipid/cholesterol/gamma-HCH transport system substrate-binding protein